VRHEERSDDRILHSSKTNNLLLFASLIAEDFQHLGLTFDVSSQIDSRGRYLGSTPQIVPLLPGGQNMPVTKANVLQYIYLLSHHKMNIELHQATMRFLKGFREIIPENWIAMFSPDELQTVIGGEEGAINVPDLKAATCYGSGYHLSQVRQNEEQRDEQRQRAV